jgi:hypothetical protein
MAAGVVAGRRTGTDWRALAPNAQMAYADGFLAGAGFAQAAATRCPAPCAGDARPAAPGGSADTGSAGPDSTALRQAMAALSRNGRFRFPYGANVYVARVNDYYWWENHRPLPIWYAFWEVNASLIGPTSEPAR